MHKLSRLDNGLRVVTNFMPELNSLAIGFWIKTGGRYETKKLQGVSHFLEHMLFKGTNRRSCQRLKQTIEEKGGVFNAFTAEEFVCYYVKILSNRRRLACDVLADMVLNPILRPQDIEKERKVISEEIRMYLDLPMQHVHELLDELIWPQHPLGASLLGRYDTIGAIRRSDLLGWMKLFHTPNNIIVVACGRIEHDNFVKEIDKFFKVCKPTSPYHFEPATRNAPIWPKTRFYHKDTEQTHICLGLRGPSHQHPDRYAIALLNIILGGNMSSRLFNEVREKRSYAYEIGSDVKQYYDTGSFLIHAGIDNKKVKDAILVIVKELKKIKEAPVSHKELSMAKEYCKGGLLMILEESMSNMLFLGEQIASIDRIITKDELLKAIDGVDIEAINRVAQKYFIDKNLKLAVIGPQQESQTKEIQELLHYLSR